jgi:hypothetical protein
MKFAAVVAKKGPTMQDKMYDMMHRHASVLYASEELTLLKIQVGDLLDSIAEKEPINLIEMHLLDIMSAMATIQMRLDIIKNVASIGKGG